MKCLERHDFGPLLYIYDSSISKGVSLFQKDSLAVRDQRLNAVRFGRRSSVHMQMQCTVGLGRNMWHIMWCCSILPLWGHGVKGQVRQRLCKEKKKKKKKKKNFYSWMEQTSNINIQICTAPSPHDRNVTRSNVKREMYHFIHLSCHFHVLIIYIICWSTVSSGAGQ